MSGRISTLLARLERIENLPTLPEVFLRIEKVIHDPRSNARDVAVVLETDPALAARVLKVANSAFFQWSQPVSSVWQAVARLGLHETRRLCLAMAVVKAFVRRSVLINHREFWVHSMTVGAAARALVDMTSASGIDRDAAFTAGLLHEIGALVLDQHFQQLYAAICNEAKRRKRAIHLVEYESLKCDHADVGAFLLERWRFPAELASAVRHHHRAGEAGESKTLCEIVQVADFLCSKSAIPGPGEELLVEPPAAVWKDLGLENVAGAGALLTTIQDAARRSELFLSLAA